MIKKIFTILFVLGSAVVISACVEDNYYMNETMPQHHYRQARVSGEAPPSSTTYTTERRSYTSPTPPPRVVNVAPPSSTSRSAPPAAPVAPVAPSYPSAPGDAAVSGEAPPSSM